MAVVMGASCSARSVRMIFLMETPVWAWRWWAMAREAVTTVRWASNGLAGVVEDWAGV